MKHAFLIAIETLEHLNIEKGLFARKALQKWPEIVGGLLAKKVHPLSYQQEILYLSVSDALWKQEVLLRKEKILQSLNTFYPERELFKDLKVILKNSHLKKS